MINRLESFITGVAKSYRAEAKFLAAIRVFYGLWVIFLPVDILWIANVPADFLHARPGAFQLLTHAPPVELLVGLSVARVVLAVFVVLGIYTLPVSMLLSLCLVGASGLSYSFSKVDHFILFELVPVFLAFAGWGSRWSIDSWRRRRSARSNVESRGMPVLLFALTIGWAMLSAAIPKVMGGWLDPSRQATRGYIARDVAIGEKLGPIGPSMLSVDFDPFWKFLDYATILAEGALILLVFTPILYRAWLALLACFHIGVFMTLGISFLDYVLVYAVFFSPVVVWLVRKLQVQRGRAAEVPVRGHPYPTADRL